MATMARAVGSHHHGAKSLVFALPAPGSVPKKAPLPYDEKAPFAGLGYRRVDERAAEGSLRLAELASK